MHIYPIETGNFKLDGGAMFGVVPKSIWEKTNPADCSCPIGSYVAQQAGTQALGSATGHQLTLSLLKQQNPVLLPTQ